MTDAPRQAGAYARPAHLPPGRTQTGASEALYARAAATSPGGVQGEGRIARPYPLYMTRAEGSRIWDVDGNEYVDYHCAFGAILLGHNHPEIAETVRLTLAEHGVTFATAHPLEIELAREIVSALPCADQAVFCCTGSEATYHALRLARGATGREKVVKLEGHYHGWHDYVAWSAHFDPRPAAAAGAAPEPVPGSAGMVGAVRDSVLVCEYNDADGIEQTIRRHGAEIAALILEPVFHNAGVILPEEGFLETCRAACSEAGVVLVFDEVITGFRHGLGGAQELYGVVPDLTTLGKAMANGFPISALAGRAELMSRLAPAGDVLFAGTFAGHVLNTAIALKSIEILRRPSVYEHLSSLGDGLREGIQRHIDETGVRAQVRQLGSVWALSFTDKRLRTFRDTGDLMSAENQRLEGEFRSWMRDHGIYIHPHYMLRGYITAAHTDDDIERTVSAVGGFVRKHRRELAATVRP